MGSSSRFASLTRRSDFLSLKQSGNLIHVNSWLLVNWRPGSLKTVRCGWTIPTHVGTAVVRNRLRRWGREFMRKWSASIYESVDLNIIFKRKELGFYRSLEHKDFDVAMEKMVAKLDRSLR